MSSPANMQPAQLARLTARANDIVGQAAQFIRSQVGQVNSQDIEIKALNSLVSYVDKRAEELLVKGLSPLLAEASFLTEEATIAATSATYQWIIDPLDGTTNFLHGLPFFSVSVALQNEKQTLLGIVREVNSDEQFVGWRGGGAWLNGQRIGVSPNTKLSEALLATGFPYYDFEQMDGYIRLLRYFMQHCRGIRRFGSAALDLAYVACGRFDGFFEYGLNAWDIAAGMLLVEEAGGRATDFSGLNSYLECGEVLAASPIVYEAMLEALQNHFHSNHSAGGSSKTVKR